jgi:hypothetical protein
MMNNSDWNLEEEEDEEKDVDDYCERCESRLRRSNVYEWSDKDRPEGEGRKDRPEGEGRNVEEQAAFESQNPFDTLLLFLCLQRRNKCEGELL